MKLSSVSEELLSLSSICKRSQPSSVWPGDPRHISVQRQVKLPDCHVRWRWTGRMHTLEHRSVKNRTAGRSLGLIPFKAFSDSEVWGILSFLVDPGP